MNKSFVRWALFGMGMVLCIWIWLFVVYAEPDWTVEKTTSNNTLTASQFNSMVDVVEETQSEINLLKNKACPNGYFDADGKCCKQFNNCKWFYYENYKKPDWTSTSEIWIETYIRDNDDVMLSIYNGGLGDYLLVDNDDKMEEGFNYSLFSCTNGALFFDWKKYTKFYALVGTSWYVLSCKIQGTMCLQSQDNYNGYVLCLDLSSAVDKTFCSSSDLGYWSNSCNNWCTLYTEESCNTCY